MVKIFKRREGFAPLGVISLLNRSSLTTLISSVQALPCTLSYIEANPDLKDDTTKGVLCGEFKILYDFFDDTLASGPVPMFFSESPDVTLQELKSSPEWAFQCLQALVSRLLVRGQLTR